VKRVTRMSPSRSRSMSASEVMTLATPSATPGLHPSPLRSPSPISRTAPTVTPPPAPPPRRRGSFFARLLAALLVIIITTFIALTATAAGLLALGYTVRTPAEAATAQARVATVEAQQLAVETRVAQLARRVDDEAETIGELRAELEALSELRAQLEDQVETGAAQSATMVAEARLSRDQVLTFATAEAGRAALLAELERRSARIERFLQRLSDIAEDAAIDLGGTPATPPAPELPETTTPVPAPDTPTPTPTAAEATPTPTAAEATPTPTPAGSPEPEETEEPTPTP